MLVNDGKILKAAATLQGHGWIPIKDSAVKVTPPIFKEQEIHTHFYEETQ